MMTFVGYYTVYPGTPTAEDAEESRKTGQNPERVREKVRALPSVLPETGKLIGSWATPSLGGSPAGVMIVEAESYADLQLITNHYRGWLAFQWHPTNTGGVART